MNLLTNEELLDLIQKATSGDKKALETVILSVQDLVFNLSLRMLGTFQDAEDAQKKVKKTIYRRFVSRKEDEKIYQKRYQTYIKLYPQLKELYRENY